MSRKCAVVALLWSTLSSWCFATSPEGAGFLARYCLDCHSADDPHGEGHGVEAVCETIIEHLPLGPRYYPEGQVTDQTERVIVAEMIREVALHHLMQEVPHSLNVQVSDWKKRRNGMIYIEAIIYVERKGQKRIVIGAKGQMLKQISSKARVEIEQELGKRIYLELWIKVRDKWRNSENWLRRWGYKPE